MIYVCVANALNLRNEPGSAATNSIVGELRTGELFESDGTESHADAWISGAVLRGVHIGKTGYVRRKWLAQWIDPTKPQPSLASDDRTEAAKIIAARTREFDAIVYHLPLDGRPKATSWAKLKSSGWIDCSGWVHLLAKEILTKYKRDEKASLLNTYSDAQITGVGARAGLVLSWTSLRKESLVPGVLVGVDFAEYSWDRNRALDIDHIVMIGADGAGTPFVSQSSSTGGGVNQVSIDKWWPSVEPLAALGRVHAADLLMLN